MPDREGMSHFNCLAICKLVDGFRAMISSVPSWTLLRASFLDCT